LQRGGELRFVKYAGDRRTVRRTSIQSALPAAGPETTDVVDSYYVKPFVHTHYASIMLLTPSASTFVSNGVATRTEDSH
jgi:hypothetical protein